MASALISAGTFPSVVAISGTMAVIGIGFAADAATKVVAATSVKTIRKTSCIFRLPGMRAEDLNIARSVALRAPRTPGPLAAPPAPTFAHILAVASLRVRSGPRVSYPKDFLLKRGMHVTARQQGNWIMVDAGQGRVGGSPPGCFEPSLRGRRARSSIGHSPDRFRPLGPGARSDGHRCMQDACRVATSGMGVIGQTAAPSLGR